jgi:hypothetical protein
MIRSPAALQQIRDQRQAQQEAQQKAELVEKYAGAAASAGQIDVGGGQNLLSKTMGGATP